MTISILISKNLRFFKLSAHEPKSQPNDHSFFFAIYTMEESIKYKEVIRLHNAC